MTKIVEIRESEWNGLKPTIMIKKQVVKTTCIILRSLTFFSSERSERFSKPMTSTQNDVVRAAIVPSALE